MPHEVENVCCQGPKVCCIDGDVFKKFYRDLPRISLQSKTRAQLRDIRRKCYEQIMTLFAKENCDPPEHCEQNDVTVPSCVKWVIRRKYPDPENIYIGFSPKYEMLKQADTVYITFQKDMLNVLNVFYIVHPTNGLLPAVSNLNENQKIALKEILPHQQQGDDPYMVEPAINTLLIYSVVAIHKAFEAYIEKIKKYFIDINFLSVTMTKSDFSEWLNYRLRNGKFTIKYDKNFFKRLPSL